MPDAPVSSEPHDELGERLIAIGLVASRYVLDLNGSLSVPHDMDLPPPWNFPSRLFQFPIEIGELRPGHARRIGLMHPLLRDHPFVAHVEASLGIALDPGGAPNAYGYSQCPTALWWHAVDLVSSGNWRALLDTRQYTTRDDIVRAVAFGCRYSGEGRPRKPLLSVSDARAILRAMNSDEPRQRTANLRRFDAPSPCAPDGGTPHWPINVSRMSGDDIAWGFVHGIEDGWFGYRSGHLEWTPLGRKRHGDDTSSELAPTVSQHSFDF